MNKITVKVDGMMCGMCESHVNDAIRNNFDIKKVNSSATKGEAVILTESDIGEGELKKAIEKTGYSVVSVKSEPYQRKGIFKLFSN